MNNDALNMNNELINIVIKKILDFCGKAKTAKNWENIFTDTGNFYSNFENDNSQEFENIKLALSQENLKNLASVTTDNDGYGIFKKLNEYLFNLFTSYGVSNELAKSYSFRITNTIIDKIKHEYPDVYEHYLLGEIKDEFNKKLSEILVEIKRTNELLEYFANKKIKVYSLRQKDIELKSKTINPKIGIDFFKVDDESFQSIFSSRLNDNKVCVKGRFIEETLFCILNELCRLNEKRSVFIVESEEDWEQIRKSDKSGNIYIPNFIADEITPIKNNTNIFIFTDDIPSFNNDLIELMPRTSDTIIKCLNEAGLNDSDAYNLAKETHCLYVAMKKKMLDGQQQATPKWLINLDSKILKTCLLLGQWSENAKDKEAIEYLSSFSYEDFKEKILAYSKCQDPLIHIVRKNGKEYYYLSSVENTWEYLQVSCHEKIWKDFEKICVESLSKFEDYFIYDSNQSLHAQINNEEPALSKEIRKGILRTLLIRVGYKNIDNAQYIVDNIVKNVLSTIDNEDKWKYISDYFVELSEISPEEVLRKLNSELYQTTGLFSLFEKQTDNLFFEKNYYPNFLASIELLLLQKEYAMDAFEWLLKLDNKCYSYKSNSPKEIIVNAIFPLHKFYAFESTNQKVMLIDKMFNLDANNAWNRVYCSMPSSNTTVVGCARTPRYREYSKEKSIDASQREEFLNYYLEILLKNTDCKDTRWSKLIGLSKYYKYDRERILNAYCLESQKMTDDENLNVSLKIRRIIHRSKSQRKKRNNSNDELQIYESILNRINFSNKEYNYVYLFNPTYEITLLNPASYDCDNYHSLNEQELFKIQEEQIKEFKSNGYSLSLLIELCTKIPNTCLGMSLARYWNDYNFDCDVFEMLLKAQKDGEIALNYFCEFRERTTQLFEQVMNIALLLQCDKKVLIGLYEKEAMFSKANPKIYSASEEIKKEFWQKTTAMPIVFNKKSIDECKKYGSLNNFIELLYFAYKDGKLTVDELYFYFSDIKKMNYIQNGIDISFFLKELLSLLQKSFIDDKMKCEKIAALELYFFGVLEWDHMVCFTKMISNDPSLYVDLVKIVYKKDDEVKHKHTEEEERRISHYYDLYYKMKFCPANINGFVNLDKLEKWILLFEKLLVDNKRKKLFGHLLGRLLAYSPIGDDYHEPCEAVRNVIEKYYNDDLASSYVTAKYNERGIFSPSGGREEQKIADNYKENANYLFECGFNKTAKLYQRLANRYIYESKKEREESLDVRF